MFFRKKLDFLISKILIITAMLMTHFAFAANSNTTASQYKTPCQNYPETYAKIMSELEKKSLCQTGLTQEQCYALYLIKGGTAVGGSLAGLAALKAGYLKLKPEEIVCEIKNALQLNIWDLILPKAQALSCQISDFTSKKAKVQEYLKQLEAELKDEIEARETKINTTVSKHAITIFENTQQQLIDALKRASQKLEAELKTFIAERDHLSSNNQDAKRLVIQKIEQQRHKLEQVQSYIKQLEKPNVRGQTRAISNLAKQAEIFLPNSEKILARDLARQSYAFNAPNGTLNTVKKILSDATTSHQDTYEKLKVESDSNAALKKISADEIINEKGLISQLKLQLAKVQQSLIEVKGISNEGALTQLIKKLPVRIISSEAIEKLAAQVGKSLSLDMAATVSRTLSTRVIPAGGRLVLGALGATFGVAAMAATYTSDMSCRSKKDTQTMTKEASLAVNYMQFDESCNAIPTLNEKSNRFFELDSESRLKLVQASPELCQMITEMSKNILASSSYNAQCKPNGFTLTQKNNPSETREIFYDNNNYNVSINTSNPISADCKKLSIDPKANTIKKTNTDCKFTKSLNTSASFTDIQNSTQGCSEETTRFASTCKVYKDEITTNLYDYAQIAKCCTGNENNYCDLANIKYEPNKSTGEMPSRSFNGSSRK